MVARSEKDGRSCAMNDRIPAARSRNGGADVSPKRDIMPILERLGRQPHAGVFEKRGLKQYDSRSAEVSLLAVEEEGRPKMIQATCPRKCCGCKRLGHVLVKKSSKTKPKKHDRNAFASTLVTNCTLSNFFMR